MSRHGYSLSGNQTCACCDEFIFNTEIYIFPCAHGFHVDCLLHYVINNRCLDRSQLTTVLKLQEQISTLSSKTEKRHQLQLQYLQNELVMYFHVCYPYSTFV